LSAGVLSGRAQACRAGAGRRPEPAHERLGAAHLLLFLEPSGLQGRHHRLHERRGALPPHLLRLELRVVRQPRARVEGLDDGDRQRAAARAELLLHGLVVHPEVVVLVVRVVHLRDSGAEARRRGAARPSPPSADSGGPPSSQRASRCRSAGGTVWVVQVGAKCSCLRGQFDQRSHSRYPGTSLARCGTVQ